MMRWMMCAVMIAALPACGGGFEEDLDPDVVMNLPAGDGAGSGATGDYELESVTTNCDGSCVLDYDTGEYSVCDVGAQLDEEAHIAQNGGALEIDVDDSLYVSQLSGGINADGSFDVGGYITQSGGEIEITSRETGVFDSDGMAMTGAARLQVRGMGLDCLIDVDFDGTRL